MPKHTHSHHQPKHDGHKGDPDKGPPMHEGAHHFDKGYASDNEHFDPYHHVEHPYRGNNYMSLQNEVVHRDSKKLSREKFSKIH